MLRVNDLMSDTLEVASPDAHLHDVLTTMNQAGCRQLPVVENDRLVGIITDRDIRLATNSPVIDTGTNLVRETVLDGVRVDDCMTPDPECVSSDTALHDVAELLSLNKFGAMPVVDEGKLVGMIRHHGQPGDRVLWQTESVDGGKTWTQTRPTKIWGLPAHLIRLRDGRLLLTYGHRRKPFGQRARISDDGGKTWLACGDIAIRDDAPNGDLGYPSTVQVGDGSLVTVWYEKMAASPYAVLRQARWSLGD